MAGTQQVDFREPALSVQRGPCFGAEVPQSWSVGQELKDRQGARVRSDAVSQMTALGLIKCHVCSWTNLAMLEAPQLWLPHFLLAE